MAAAVGNRVNRAVFRYEHGLVVAALNRRLKLVARWDDIVAIYTTERRAVFYFTLTVLRWTEYALEHRAGTVTFTTTWRDDAEALNYIIEDRLHG